MHIGTGDRLCNQPFSHLSDLFDLSSENTAYMQHTCVYHSYTSTYTPNFVQILKTFCGGTQSQLKKESLIKPDNIFVSYETTQVSI